jgi:hypothetical protein
MQHVDNLSQPMHSFRIVAGEPDSRTRDTIFRATGRWNGSSESDYMRSVQSSGIVIMNYYIRRHFLFVEDLVWCIPK